MESIFLQKFIIFICHLAIYFTDCNSEILKQNIIKDAVEIGAICNDGSPGIYYLHKNTNSSDWIIFLDGGGGCSSHSECRERAKKTPYFMSSNNYPEQIESRSILSGPMFKGYNKALLVYCSSDSWLGDNIFVSKQNTKSNSSRTYNRNKPVSKIDTAKNNYDILGGYSFQGDVIFNSVINELLSKGLNESVNVMLSGTSAGGVGAFNHVKRLRHRLPTKQISIIVDSSWFINYDGYFQRRSNPDFIKATGILKQVSCRDASWGFPCCYSMPCMMTKGYIPHDVNILAVFSKYDVYVLFDQLMSRGTVHKGNILKSKDLLINVDSYGGQMLQSLEIVQTYPNFSYIFTSCFQHGYFASSNLWETAYKSHVKLLFHSVKFEHVVDGSHWKKITVDGTSIEDIVNTWYNQILTRNQTSGNRVTSTLKFSDSCLHAQCNPTCPRVIYFDDYQSSWPMWQRVMLLFIVVIIFLSCLVLKILWMIHHFKLKKTQHLYLSRNYEGGELFERVMCLPTCPPHSSVGISCSMLEYDILNQAQPEIGTLKRTKYEHNRKRSLPNLRRRSVIGVSKKIIKGITAYFNPGQLVAIMGPSGSGKTTLLDVLTARKHLKEAEANIFINGLPAEETRDWFIKNSGYVLQLATPYHEELTVRQNLTYSAMMRLPKKMPIKDKMWRVEQVLGQCGLYNVANIVVGDNAPSGGGGLSGGQRNSSLRLTETDMV